MCPLWPTQQQRLMPQPRLLHPAHNGAPCSKQSVPSVPAPAPNGRPRCEAASGTLLGGARGDPVAYGSMGGGWGLERAWEIVHKEMVAQRRSARKRSQALDPQVTAVRRQPHKLQHHLVARGEERVGRKPRAHAAP